MSNTKAAIICDDTLRACGLKHLLDDIMHVDAVIASDEAHIPADAHIYFITPDALVRLHRFFMPRMRRTVVLTREPVRSAVLTLDTSVSESSIIKELSTIISSLPGDSQEANQLSEREIEVLRLVARGHINKEIATQLGISVNTVLTHRKNLAAKLHIRNASGMAVYALMNGII